MSTPETMAMAQSIAIPEPGVPEAQWLRVGPAYVINLREENAKLREDKKRLDWMLANSASAICTREQIDVILNRKAASDGAWMRDVQRYLPHVDLIT